MNDHTQRTKEIIEQIRYATLATVCEDGSPWNSPVSSVHDSDLNIYWVSDKENQHSQNVRATGKAFIVIYDSTVPEGEGEGVYIQATVYQLDDPEEIRAMRRIKKGADHDAPDDFMGDAVRRVYKAVPERVWMNDAEVQDGVFIRDYRYEIPLKDLKQLFAE